MVVVAKHRGLGTAKALQAAMQAEDVKVAQVAKVKYWNCKNCGHLAEQTAQLKELSFKWLGPRTSKTTCPNCGSYTLQQAYDETFKAGYFVVVKSYNGIRGKG